MTRQTKYSLLTPSQTVGPFFHDALLRPDARRETLVSPNAKDEVIRIEGVVYDGDHNPVPDALIEIWQADEQGRYRHSEDGSSTPNEHGFTGFGRCGTNETGAYAFETVKPGGVLFDSAHRQAPHISMAVFARGLLNHLFTRLYFDGDVANDNDPVLARVPHARRSTLLARRTTRGERSVYVFDVVLQGEGETVFFDFTPPQSHSDTRSAHAESHSLGGA